MLVSDNQLTTDALHGDKDALADLLQRHDPELRDWLFGQINPKYLAQFDIDDVLQVTYLEAFLRIRQFEPRGSGSFQAWLRRMADHNIKDAIRLINSAKRPSPDKRVGLVAPDQSYALLLSSLPGQGTTPTAGAARSEAAALIERALDKLPPDYAQVIRLCDLEGLSADEAARRMDRSRAAIHMLKARAHDRLAELLGESTDFFSKGA